MDLLDFILVSLALIGLSHIFVDGYIMIPFKQQLSQPKWLETTWKMPFPFSWYFESKEWRPYEKLIDMLNCYQCSGFWSGLIVISLHYLSLIEFSFYGVWFSLFWIRAFLWAFAASFLSTLGAVVIGYFNMANGGK